MFFHCYLCRYTKKLVCCYTRGELSSLAAAWLLSRRRDINFPSSKVSARSSKQFFNAFLGRKAVFSVSGLRLPAYNSSESSTNMFAQIGYSLSSHFPVLLQTKTFSAQKSHRPTVAYPFYFAIHTLSRFLCQIGSRLETPPLFYSMV